jgi:P27 family predicted phage terminase small subunit
MLIPPKDLPEEGQTLWRSMGKLLLDAGLLTHGDVIALEMLCLSYARMKKANREVLVEGEVLVSDNGGYYQNPWLSIANRAWEQVKGMLGEFGLTPAERTRVMAAIEQDEDDLADLLFRPVPMKESNE